MARFALSTNRPEFLQERHGLDTPAFRSARKSCGGGGLEKTEEHQESMA